jgi:two-component system NarL family response regulator
MRMAGASRAALPPGPGDREAPVTLARVVIADEHAPSRMGIRMALEAAGLTVVAEAASGQDAVEVTIAERPDICLLDVDMPGGGVPAARRITERLPQTAVVLLASVPAEEDLLAAVRAGAVGYLAKTMDPARLAPTLLRVIAGEAAIPRAMVAPLLSKLRTDPPGRAASLNGRTAALTPREAEVLELMARDYTTREIGARLGIVDVTVRRHISEVLRKLGAPDRRAALTASGWARADAAR